MPAWNMRNSPFLDDLDSAGFARETIDTVLCTHLHVDHVGWNTMLVDGEWKPTFPNARYLFAKEEWAYWKEEPDASLGPVIQDSVRPIVDAGLADLVEMNHSITSEISLEPTPGHTPGHVSVHIRSEGEDILDAIREAIQIGKGARVPVDIIHLKIADKRLWGEMSKVRDLINQARRFCGNG